MSIELRQVSYTDMPGTTFERRALSHVTLTIPEGTLTAIAGHTGSGKSTLVQHLNGILHPTQGTVRVDGQNLADKGQEAVAARQRVGMVFQYPEHQLFEETVMADVAFGPKNLGLSSEEIETRVRRAMELVRLDYDTYKNCSPFQLSGGQKRRVAIAGVLAMEPKYLILDEPAAGLDPRGRDDLLKRIVRLHREKKMTVIFVSHNMDDIARLADRVVIMHEGEVLLDATPRKAFQSEALIQKAGLDTPSTVTLLKKLQAGGLSVTVDAFTIEGAVKSIEGAWRERRAKKC